MPDQFSVPTGGITIAGDDSGGGEAGRPAVVLLHGLTATRRYVVMGSRSLERSGHRVIGYDARGHGQSGPAAAPAEYGYDRLAADLAAVLDARDVDRAVLAGASMGAHTLLRFAIDHPGRVAGLVVITPAFADPAQAFDPARLEQWDRLAAGLRAGGIGGFLAASDLAALDPKLRETVTTVIRQRLAKHEHLTAVADALSVVPRSVPFAGIDALAQIAAPVAIVASSDAADPDHPEAVAARYAATITGARLIRDEPGRSPRAWQGSQVSQVIASVADEAAKRQPRPPTTDV